MASKLSSKPSNSTNSKISSSTAADLQYFESKRPRVTDDSQDQPTEMLIAAPDLTWRVIEPVDELDLELPKEKNALKVNKYLSEMQKVDEMRPSKKQPSSIIVNKSELPNEEILTLRKIKRPKARIMKQRTEEASDSDD